MNSKLRKPFEKFEFNGENVHNFAMQSPGFSMFGVIFSNPKNIATWQMSRRFYPDLSFLNLLRKLNGFQLIFKLTSKNTWIKSLEVMQSLSSKRPMNWC